MAKDIKELDKVPEHLRLFLTLLLRFHCDIVSAESARLMDVLEGRMPFRRDRSSKRRSTRTHCLPTLVRLPLVYTMTANEKGRQRVMPQSAKLSYKGDVRKKVGPWRRISSRGRVGTKKTGRYSRHVRTGCMVRDWEWLSVLSLDTQVRRRRPVRQLPTHLSVGASAEGAARGAKSGLVLAFLPPDQVLPQYPRLLLVRYIVKGAVVWCARPPRASEISHRHATRRSAGAGSVWEIDESQASRSAYGRA